MKEEGFNPNAVITDQVIDALANIQDHEPGSFREHTEKLTDILLDDFELMEPDNLKVGSINSIFYFLHKAAEPFNCLEQDNLA